jgi:hypothetical protein
MVPPEDVPSEPRYRWAIAPRMFSVPMEFPAL